MTRPELTAPPEIYYDAEEAAKYTFNAHIMTVQTRLAQRCLELLMLPRNTPALILDIGCGSGLSGAVLSEEGHHWIGIDISADMLRVAKKQNEIKADVLLADMGQNLRWKTASFDGAISVSAVQWLCNADQADHDPFQRLGVFFKWLYASLVPGARAVLQFYPKDSRQSEMIQQAATKAGFGGGVLVDNPKSTRAQKHYLVIWAGADHADGRMPTPVENEEEEPTIAVSERNKKRGLLRQSDTKKRQPVKDRNWVLQKKQRLRSQGLEVKTDSKYTARKRQDRF